MFDHLPCVHDVSGLGGGSADSETQNVSTLQLGANHVDFTCFINSVQEVFVSLIRALNVTDKKDR